MSVISFILNKIYYKTKHDKLITIPKTFTEVKIFENKKLSKK